MLSYSHALMLSYYHTRFLVGPRERRRFLKRHGCGDVLCNAQVGRITRDSTGAVSGVRVSKRSEAGVEDHKIEIKASRVVNAAGIHHLYREGGLLDDETLRAQLHASARFVPSKSHMYVFVCLKGDPSELGLEKTNMCASSLASSPGCSPCMLPRATLYTAWAPVPLAWR